jgi:hypothetical protein
MVEDLRGSWQLLELWVFFRGDGNGAGFHHGSDFRGIAMYIS